MNIRRIELPCKSGDGSTLYVMQEDTRAEGSELPDYVIMRTTGGQPVHIALRDARELAGWLIEHAVDADDPHVVNVPAGHGVAMFGGGGSGGIGDHIPYVGRCDRSDCDKYGEQITAGHLHMHTI